jgi:phospholipase D-like protein
MGIFAGMSILALVLFGFVLAFLWLVALVDILRSDFEGNDKIVWILVVIIFPFIGSILYFAIGRSRKIRR